MYYRIECELAKPGQWNAPFLRWTAARRLGHLREGLHDPVKNELGSAYRTMFQGVHFAHKVAVKGTTSRLDAWCKKLAGCLNAKELPPVIASTSLRLLLPGDHDPESVVLEPSDGNGAVVSGMEPATEAPAVIVAESHTLCAEDSTSSDDEEGVGADENASDRDECESRAGGDSPNADLDEGRGDATSSPPNLEGSTEEECPARSEQRRAASPARSGAGSPGGGRSVSASSNSPVQVTSPAREATAAAVPSTVLPAQAMSPALEAAAATPPRTASDVASPATSAAPVSPAQASPASPVAALAPHSPAIRVESEAAGESPSSPTRSAAGKEQQGSPGSPKEGKSEGMPDTTPASVVAAAATPGSSKDEVGSPVKEADSETPVQQSAETAKASIQTTVSDAEPVPDAESSEGADNI